MKKRTKKIMALMMTAAVAATTFGAGGSTLVYAEDAEDYSEPLPEDYEGTLTMWGVGRPLF